MSQGWPMVPLGTICEPAERWQTPVPGVEYRQVGVRLWGEGAYEREPLDGADTKYRVLNRTARGDIIVNKIWARNGSVSVVDERLAGCYCSAEFPLFQPNTGALNPRWFYWITKTRWFWERCDAQSRGTSGKNRIRPEKFLEIRIPLPPLPEQRRIVAKVEVLAAKIEEARGMRARAADLASVLIPASTTEVFHRLDTYPKVPIRTLGEDGVNPVQTGPFGAQLHATEFVEEGVPVLNVGNVWPEGLRLDYLDHVTPEKAAHLARYRLCKDDLLFARSGATLGKVCIVPEQCDGWLMTGHLFRIRFDQTRSLPSFAFAALRGASQVRSEVFEQVRGATRPGFNTTLLGNVTLPLPSIDEQRRIVAYLDDLQAKVDSLKALQAQSAAELDALLPSVLDRAFKGQL